MSPVHSVGNRSRSHRIVAPSKAALALPLALLLILGACGGGASPEAPSGTGSGSGQTGNSTGNGGADGNNDTTNNGTSNPNTGVEGGGDDTNGAGGTDPSGMYDRDCFWAVQSEASVVNTLYPDKFATYWIASFDIPPGGEIVFKGQYPHARYISFISYNPQLQPLDGIADIEITPDNGSNNPAAPGADRTDPDRDYTVRVIAAVPPASLLDREPNTLYSFQGNGDNRVASNKANVIYRIYITDDGADLSGDVGLPTVIVKDASGGEVTGTDACSAATPFQPPSAIDELRQGSDPTQNIPSTIFFGSETINWLKFFNFQGSQANRYNSTPAGAPLLASPLNSENSGGGFASNIHNNYIYAQLDHGAEDNNPFTRLVGVFEFKAPNTPTTFNNDTVMGDGDMRYWSICTNENNGQSFIDCVYDEQTIPPKRIGISGQIEADPDNADRRIVVVARPDPNERPSNATEECGVTYLSWGSATSTIVIMRNMLSKPSFQHSYQQIPPTPGECEEAILNPDFNAVDLTTQMPQADSNSYFPYGSHLTKAQFESLGCPVNVADISNVSAQITRNDCTPNNPNN